MPRTPDPELESRLVLAALRLLDGGGLPAVTMRAVARQAGTTTPTIYHRFAAREALLSAVILEVEGEIMAHLLPHRATVRYVNAFLDFTQRHPQRFELLAETFGARFVWGQPTPAYDALKERLQRETGAKGNRREDLAMAIASLAIGTARAMIAVSKDPAAVAEFRRCCLAAVRLLLKSFTRRAH